MSDFYNSIVDSKSEVGKVFQNLWDNSEETDWNDLQVQFHDSIESEFPAIRCELNDSIAEEHNPIPKRLIKRIQVATLILTALVLGKKYNRNLYLNIVEFCGTSNLINRQNALLFN